MLANRHHCQLCGGELKIDNPNDFTDFIVHELTHTRQATLLAENAGVWGWARHPGRGSHRDKGWYTAISEACPNYLGHELPESAWPKRYSDATLTEPEMTHWPASIRALVKRRDPRLPKPSKVA